MNNGFWVGLAVGVPLGVLAWATLAVVLPTAWVGAAAAAVAVVLLAVAAYSDIRAVRAAG